jgi:hypothetical protein
VPGLLSGPRLFLPEELPRTPNLGTRGNKGKRKGQGSPAKDAPARSVYLHPGADSYNTFKLRLESAQAADSGLPLWRLEKEGETERRVNVATVLC